MSNIEKDYRALTNEFINNLQAIRHLLEAIDNLQKISLEASEELRGKISVIIELMGRTVSDMIHNLEAIFDLHQKLIFEDLGLDKKDTL